LCLRVRGLGGRVRSGGNSLFEGFEGLACFRVEAGEFAGDALLDVKF